ncbi:MAG: hypothetical protein NVSMB42_02520 [Herpetosiphon sp.]
MHGMEGLGEVLRCERNQRLQCREEIGSEHLWLSVPGATMNDPMANRLHLLNEARLMKPAQQCVQCGSMRGKRRALIQDGVAICIDHPQPAVVPTDALNLHFSDDGLRLIDHVDRRFKA